MMKKFIVVTTSRTYFSLCGPHRVGAEEQNAEEQHLSDPLLGDEHWY